MGKTYDKQNLKSAYRFSIIAIFVFYALYLVTVPILLGVNADAAYKNTLIPQLVKLMGKIFEVCGIAVIYAISIFSVYRRGRAGIGSGYLLCGITALVKCLFAQTVYWLVSGGIPAFNNGLIGELIWLVVLPAVLELAQFTVFFMIAARRILNYRRGYEIGRDAARSKGAEYPSIDTWVYPFDGAFDFKNPLLFGGLVGGFVITVSKVVLSILEEIDMAINGLVIKNAGDLLLSVGGFVSDFACGILAYTVIVFVIIKAFDLNGKNKKESSKENNHEGH